MTDKEYKCRMSTELDEYEVHIRAIQNSAEYQKLITNHRGPNEERRLSHLNMKINSWRTQQTLAHKTAPVVTKGLQAAKTATKTPAPASLNISGSGVIKAKPLGAGIAGGNMLAREIELPEVKEQEPLSKIGVVKAAKPLLATEPPKVPITEDEKPILTLSGSGNNFGTLGMSKPPKLSTKSDAIKPPPPAKVYHPPAPKLSSAIRKGMAPPPKPAPVTKTDGPYSTIGKNGKPSSHGSIKAAAPASINRKPAMSKPTEALLRGGGSDKGEPRERFTGHLKPSARRVEADDIDYLDDLDVLGGEDLYELSDEEVRENDKLNDDGDLSDISDDD